MFWAFCRSLVKSRGHGSAELGIDSESETSDSRLLSRVSSLKSQVSSLILILVFGLLIFSIGCSNANSEVRTREATHADGLWYPSTASELGRMVDGFLAKVKKESTPGRIIALIAPHAGYGYCGQLAAHAYKQIEGARFDAVVLIGSSHNYRFPGASVYESGVYRNPLGDVEVDSATAKQLINECEAIKFQPRVHIPEHSLENQIPFLQRTLSEFKIVPIILGNSGKEDTDVISKALISVLKGKNVLLIASTDIESMGGRTND